MQPCDHQDSSLMPCWSCLRYPCTSLPQGAAVWMNCTNSLLHVLFLCCMGASFQKSLVGGRLFLNQDNINVEHVCLEHLALLVRTTQRILRCSDECFRDNNVLDIRVPRSSFGSLQRRSQRSIDINALGWCDYAWVAHCDQVQM